MDGMLAVACGLWLTLAATTQEPSRTTVTLQGQVVGANGKRVQITLWHNDGPRSTVEPIAAVFSAEDGTFRIADVPWFAGNQWGWDWIVLVAQTGDRVVLQQLRGDDIALDALRIEVAPPTDLTGVLVDAVTRQPIGGAEVWPWIYGDPMGKEPYVWTTGPLLPWHAITDAAGRFVLKGVPSFASYVLIAAGPDHARTQIRVAEPRQPIDQALARGGRIVGHVRMPDGSPAGRVLVEATSNGDGYGRATTDDQGLFTVISLPAGKYKVFAQAPELTVIAATGVAVTAGDTAEGVDLQLVRGGFVVGRIVDDATGKPLQPSPSTDVAMYGPARGFGGACEVAPVRADGTFRIRAPAGRNHIYLRGADGWVEPKQDLTVVEDEDTVVEWRLRRR